MTASGSITDGTLSALLIAVFAFIASHFVLSSHPIRKRLVGFLGEMAFLGLYSAVAAGFLVLSVHAYADAPRVVLWAPTSALKHLSLAIMPLACILIVAGYTTPSVAAVSLDPQGLARRQAAGIQKVTRHPILWGIALWACAHIVATGDGAGLIFFGGMALLALGGAVHIDARRRQLFGHRWANFAASTSFVPFAALLGRRVTVTMGEIGWWRLVLGLGLFGVLLWVHPWLFGVPAFSY